jgi:hypothetical protein
VSSLTQALYEAFIVELNGKDQNVECIHKGLEPIHVQFIQDMEAQTQCSYLTFSMGQKIQKWSISFEENKTVSNWWFLFIVY